MPPVLAATGLAGAGFAAFHAETAWAFAAASALVLSAAFALTVLRRRTTKGALPFLAGALLVAIVAAEPLLTAYSLVLSGAARALLLWDRLERGGP